MKRNDIKALLRRWALSIDMFAIIIIMSIISIGIWVSIASTPAVAIKLGLQPFHFVKHHIMVVPVAITTMVVVSFLQPHHVRKFSFIGYVLCILLLIGVLLFGTEVKGGKRWIKIAMFSLQPSEFLKPTLTVLTAWLISEQYHDRKFPGIMLSIVSVSIVVPLLLLQPDVGMTVVLTATWFGQLFISGISAFMVCLFGGLAIFAFGALYFVLPHFAERINGFLNGSGEDIYQVRKSLEAFRNGGLLGKGPGEGVVKTLVPDAHSDFVFSVIGEEFGFVLCFIIIALFVILIVRSLVKVMQSSNMFNFSAVFGLTFQLGIQILINLATSMNLMPAKGVTLPFISYGGSSFLATSVSIGILLALTKKNLLK